MINEFTAVFEKVGDTYVAYAEELPGANTQGHTLEEARENLKDAIQLVLESNRAITESDLANKIVVKEPIRINAV
ncbi:MAG: type II toxin-antitoxin system HicB family antitoxin [Pseudomonadota bacterium]